MEKKLSAFRKSNATVGDLALEIQRDFVKFFSTKYFRLIFPLTNPNL